MRLSKQGLRLCGCVRRRRTGVFTLCERDMHSSALSAAFGGYALYRPAGLVRAGVCLWHG